MSPRYAARTDDNQAEIVQALRMVGASVAITSMVGAGFPDLVVGFRGVTYLMELKNGALSPSRRKLTPQEQEFSDAWRGHYALAHDATEALAIIGVEAML